MRFPTKLMMASMLALFIAAPVHAQSPNYWAQQGDYYRFQPWTPQQVTPAQKRRIQGGDYYKPVATVVQQNSPRDAAMRKCIKAAQRAAGTSVKANMARSDYYESCMFTAGSQP